MRRNDMIIARIFLSGIWVLRRVLTMDGMRIARTEARRATPMSMKKRSLWGL
jgi:hypothetical protein